MALSLSHNVQDTSESLFSLGYAARLFQQRQVI